MASPQRSERNPHDGASSLPGASNAMAAPTNAKHSTHNAGSTPSGGPLQNGPAPHPSQSSPQPEYRMKRTGFSGPFPLPKKQTAIPIPPISPPPPSYPSSTGKAAAGEKMPTAVLNPTVGSTQHTQRHSTGNFTPAGPQVAVDYVTRYPKADGVPAQVLSDVTNNTKKTLVSSSCGRRNEVPIKPSLIPAYRV